MKINKPLIVSAAFVAVAAAIGVSGIRLSSTWSAGKAPTQEPPQRVLVRTLIPDLKIVHWEKTNDGEIRLKVRNGHSKSVEAFVLGVGNREIIRDLKNTQRGRILPGETDEFTIPLPETPEEHVISFYAVVFDDGTSKGHPDKVKAVKEQRKGKKN